MGETKKHPWDRIPRRRFHTGILSGLFQALKKPGMKRTSWNSFQTCFFDFPHRWGKSKKTVWDRIPRRRFHTRLLSGLLEAAQKCRVENVVQLRSKRVFSTFAIDGRKSKKHRWDRNSTTFGFIPGFFPCLEKPTQNDGMKPTSWNSIPRVFFRFAPMGKVEKTRFERNWTTFVNPAFCPAWKSPPKMVV